jgi:hypothetical protein
VSWIDQGVKEIEILVFWSILHSHYRFANARLAPQSTTERSTECCDDALAGLCLFIRFRRQTCQRFTKNGAADGLSRRGKGEDYETDSNPDNYFDSYLYSITAISSSNPSDEYQVYHVKFDPTKYKGDDLVLGKYLATLRQPEGTLDGDYTQLRKKAKNFMVRDGMLFKRSKKGGVPPQRVIGLQEERIKVIKEIHELGHPERKATYNQVSW